MYDFHCSYFILTDCQRKQVHNNLSEIPLSLNSFYKVAVAVQRQRVIYTDYSGFASPALIGEAIYIRVFDRK
jgi:hypothetical protein